jgi:hypothetical protein
LSLFPGDSSGVLTNSGTLQAISGSSLSIGPNYSLTGGTLNVGLNSAAVYGHIQFTSLFSADGTFSVTALNGYRPNPGDSFKVLTFPSATNAFTCYSGLDLGGGLRLVPQFTATSMSLVATTYETNSSLPQLSISRAPNSVLLTWPLGYPDWTLQSSTDLSTTNWQAVPNPCGNQATVPQTVPAQYFRLGKTN